MATALFPRRKSSRPRASGGQMSLMDHLGELRRRILISALAVTVGAIVMFFLSNAVIEFLVTYYEDATQGQRNALIFTGPADGFITRLKVATYGGIVLALPVWLYQLWRFITPGLNPKEKRYAIPFVASAIVLFAIGAFVAFLTLEPALRFLINVGGSAQSPQFTSDRYLTLVSLMIVAFGLSFEFPVVLVFLLLARVITTAQLRHFHRWAIVLIVTFAAVITPSQDPYSLFFMAGPMYLFYEGSIVIGRILKR
jgi:sec-independent protein translocase protein TatC